MEASALLLLEVQCEAQTRGVNPLFAHLGQPPYGAILGQGICDLCQACWIDNVGEAVALLAEAEVSLSGLASDALVAVEDDLRAEWRMASHFDGDVAPVWIQDMKRIVVHVRRLLGQTHPAAAPVLNVP